MRVRRTEAHKEKFAARSSAASMTEGRSQKLCMSIHDSNRLTATLTLHLDVLCADWAPGCEILQSLCPYAPPSTGNSTPTRPTIQSSHPKPRTDDPSLSAATFLRIRPMGVAIRSRRYNGTRHGDDFTMICGPIISQKSGFSACPVAECPCAANSLTASC